MSNKPKEKTDEEYLEQFKDWYKTADKHQKGWRNEAEESFDFEAGRQWTAEDLAKLEEDERPVVTFNRTAPVIDSVTGTEVNNRQEVRYIPRTMGKVQVNEIVTGAAQWVRDECDAEDEESDAFHDCAVCGMGWTETRIETDENPEGKVVVSRVDPLEMMWDSRSKKPNIVDAQWIIRHKDVMMDDAETMFPDANPDQLHAHWAMDPIGDTPHDATEAPFYRKDQGEGTGKEVRKKIRLVEVQWWEHEVYHFALDPFTGEKKQLSDSDLTKLNKRVNELNRVIEEHNSNPENLLDKKDTLKVESVKMRRRVYKRAFVGADILDIGPAPCPFSFNYKCITGKRDRNKNLWYGVMRAMKDPQRWANKWLAQTMHIMNTNSKGGVLAETDAVANVRAFEEQWSDPSAVTWLLPGGMAKIKEKTFSQFPAGFNNLMQFAISAIPDVTGINLNFMALQKGDEAAILDRQRKQTALTILATLFNNLRRYRKEQGRLLFHYITTYIADGRLIRITEKENEQYIPFIHDPSTKEYDVIVDDNPTSPNQKDRTWSIILQLLPILKGMPLPPDVWMQIIKQSPLPNSFTEAIKKITEKGMPPQPMQQAQIQKLIAQAEKDKATAAKTMAETQQVPKEHLLNVLEIIIELGKIMSTPEQQPMVPQEQSTPQQMPQEVMQ